MHTRTSDRNEGNAATSYILLVLYCNNSLSDSTIYLSSAIKTMPSSVPSLPAVMIYNGNGNDISMAIATSKDTPRRRCRRHQLHQSIHLWLFLYMLIGLSCIMNSYTSRNCGSSSGFVGNTNNFFLVAAADNVNESNDNDGDGGDDDDDD